MEFYSANLDYESFASRIFSDLIHCEYTKITGISIQ